MIMMSLVQFPWIGSILFVHPDVWIIDIYEGSSHVRTRFIFLDNYRCGC